MNLYFGSLWSLLSTLGLIICLFYIIKTFINRYNVKHWKKKVIELAGIGLILCIFVVMRDDYVSSMQGGQGVFAYNAYQIYICYFLTTIIVCSFLIGILVKKERYQRMMFYILSMAIISKIIIIEVSRILIG